MDVYVARQPIFDAAEAVVGYELVHHDHGPTDPADDVTVTRQLLSDHLLSDPRLTLTGGLPVWVRFPRALLLDGSATLAPPDRVVVMLPADATDDPDTLAACEDLQNQSYQLAVDATTDPVRSPALLQLADVVMVDLTTTGAGEVRRLAGRVRSDAQLLATAVDTRASKDVAVELGCQLLQGAFLQDPVTFSRRVVARSPVTALAAISAVTKDPMDFDEVQGAIKRDIALTDRLLRYLNSVSFGFRGRVASIRQALVILGEIQVRRWVTVTALSTVGVDANRALLVSTLFRARMCEQLAALVPSDVLLFEAFLTGMYSRMHLLIGIEFEEMIDDAPVPAAVRDALTTRTGVLWALLRLVVAWEHGDWEHVTAARTDLGVHAADLSACYLHAIGFGEEAVARVPPLSGDRMIPTG